MAMVKQSSSRYEQKRMSRLESGIRAAQQSGITSDQIKQIIRHVYSSEKQDSEEGNVTKLDVNKWDGQVFDKKHDAVKVRRHVELPVHTYEQFEGKQSQRFSRPVVKMFLNHPERVEQYNLLRDHRFSRFMATDIIQKAYCEKVNRNSGKEELSSGMPKTLDITTRGWQKLLKEHKNLFTKLYDILVNEGLSHIKAVNIIFKEMDEEYRATKGKSIFSQINEIPKQVDSAGNHDFEARGWKPELKRRYYRRYEQAR